MRHKLNRLYARVKVKEGTSVTNKVLAPFFLTVIDKTENLLLNSPIILFFDLHPSICYLFGPIFPRCKNGQTIPGTIRDGHRNNKIFVSQAVE